jgi:hypothetical protein
MRPGRVTVISGGSAVLAITTIVVVIYDHCRGRSPARSPLFNQAAGNVSSAHPRALVFV